MEQISKIPGAPPPHLPCWSVIIHKSQTKYTSEIAGQNLHYKIIFMLIKKIELIVNQGNDEFNTFHVRTITNPRKDIFTNENQGNTVKSIFHHGNHQAVIVST